MQPNTTALLGQLGDVDLRLLRVFKAVADCGGMAAAELELNLAMSTISRHVKDLEIRLGLVLCRRGRAGFALTPEGTQVYTAATHLLAATDAFRGQLHDIHRRMGGDLHVALFEKTATNPDAHIGKAIERFQGLAPKVHLHLHVGPIGMIERGVIDGQFHLGIIPEHRRSDSLDYLDLFGETMLLYVSPKHPWFDASKDAARDWQALRGEALAGLGYHSPNMALTHTQRLERAATANNQEAVATLILSGSYVGFLPDHYAQTFVQAGQMRAVAPQVLRYDCRFSCIWRHAPGPLRMAEAFIQSLRESH